MGVFSTSLFIFIHYFVIRTSDGNKIRCLNGGRLNSTTYTCECRPPYFGPQCQSFTCENNSYCNRHLPIHPFQHFCKITVNFGTIPSETVCTVKCKCGPATDGTPISDYCSPTLTANNGPAGKKSNITPSYRQQHHHNNHRSAMETPCKCRDGTDGRFCEQIVHCNRRGKLIIGNNNNNRRRNVTDVLRVPNFPISLKQPENRCLCYKGFIGPSCLDLDHSVCQNGGQITRNRSCICQNRYFGDFCEYYCTIGGYLSETIVDFEGHQIKNVYCECNPHYTGQFCQTLAVDEKPTVIGRLALCLIVVIPLIIQLITISTIIVFYKRKQRMAQHRAFQAAAEIFGLPPSLSSLSSSSIITAGGGNRSSAIGSISQRTAQILQIHALSSRYGSTSSNNNIHQSRTSGSVDEADQLRFHEMSQLGPLPSYEDVIRGTQEVNAQNIISSDRQIGAAESSSRQVSEEQHFNGDNSESIASFDAQRNLNDYESGELTSQSPDNSAETHNRRKSSATSNSTIHDQKISVPTNNHNLTENYSEELKIGNSSQKLYSITDDPEIGTENEIQVTAV